MKSYRSKNRTKFSSSLYLVSLFDFCFHWSCDALVDYDHPKGSRLFSLHEAGCVTGKATLTNSRFVERWNCKLAGGLGPIHFAWTWFGLDFVSLSSTCQAVDVVGNRLWERTFSMSKATIRGSRCHVFTCLTFFFYSYFVSRLISSLR